LYALAALGIAPDAGASLPEKCYLKMRTARLIEGE
jgi:hypothetical protein